jgi:hypothetical protein
MEIAIADTAQEVEDVFSGLQAFGEHLPEQNTRIPESIQELVALFKGLGRLKAIKLTGERPYAQVWFDLCNHFEEKEEGLLLWPRLELYSLFLKEILEYLRGSRPACVPVACADVSQDTGGSHRVRRAPPGNHQAAQAPDGRLVDAARGPAGRSVPTRHSVLRPGTEANI